MDFSFFWLALGIAAAGYCIGDGLKNFKNPNAKSLIDSLDEEEDHQLIKENDVHRFIGISKEDTQSLLQDYPDIPHLMINGRVFFPKSKLRKWLMQIGEK